LREKNRINKHRNQKEDWEILSEIDPLHAIIGGSLKIDNELHMKEFFETGIDEIKGIMTKCNSLSLPNNYENALDFGCGIGRLSRALRKYFNNVYGIDISENMIKLAKQKNKKDNLNFLLNEKNDLSVFTDQIFDLIYSNITLQHIADKKTIELFIYEFIRVLRNDGILIFQLPYHIPKKYKIQPKRRLYGFLKKLGMNNKFLINKLHLSPMVMNYLEKEKILKIIKKSNANLIDIKSHTSTRGGIKSYVYFITK
jgi:ubiquinone/menaquinone biosynthesis C-methylase UbiE